MSKKTQRWPIWKIVVATIACAVVSPVLFWLSVLAEKTVDKVSPDTTSQRPVLTLSSVIMMVAIAVGMLAVLGVIWLVYRINDARTPAWQKKMKKKRF